MLFELVTFSTLVNYEAHFMAEVSKRMKNTELNGYRILSGVVDALVRTGVNGPEELPNIRNECDVKKDCAGE